MRKLSQRLLAWLMTLTLVFTGSAVFMAGTAEAAADDELTVKVTVNGEPAEGIELILVSSAGEHDNYDFDDPTDADGIATYTSCGEEGCIDSDDTYYLITVVDDEGIYEYQAPKLTFTLDMTAWATNFYQVDGVDYTPGDIVTLALTTAVQPEEYTVTFDPNGGTVDPTSATTVEGKLESLPTPACPDGCAFVGWYTAAEGGDKVTTDTEFTEDTTIYAQWVNPASWDANDFTYGEWTLNTDTGSSGSDAVFPGNDRTYLLPGTKWVVTGFSERGVAKLLAGNTDLVIPDKDPDGKTVQGVGKEAFKANKRGNPLYENNIKLTSVTFPEDVMTTENIDDINEKWGGAGNLGKHGNLEKIGDFFIGNGSFAGNALTELTLPEGVLYVNMYAFQNNTSLTKVTFPSTIALIVSGAFNKTGLTEVNFPDETDVRLTIQNQAFMNTTSQIHEVTLPRDTLQVGRAVFENKEQTVTAYVKGDEPAVNSTPAAAKVDLKFVTSSRSEHVDGTDATCEEDGAAEYYKCLACGKYFSDEAMTTEISEDDLVIPAKGHDWGEPVITGEGEDKMITYTCQNDPSHTKTMKYDWEPGDFTYGEWTLNTETSSSGSDAVFPGNDRTYLLPGTKWVVTGFTEQGVDKLLAGNTDLVIPDKDPDGKIVQGVGKDAFKANKRGNPLYENDIKLTSVTFPEDVMTTENIDDINEKWGGAGYLGKHGNLEKIGDFFIGNGSFAGNALTELTLPEGVLYVNMYAFQNNTSLTKVTFPSTIALIVSGAFNKTGLTEVNFPDETDVRLTIQNQAFMNTTSQIHEVTLPRATLQVGRAVFENKEHTVTAHVKGEEPAINATPASAKNDIVFDVSPDSEHVDGTDATCEEDGTAEHYKCLVCGKLFSDEAMTQEITEDDLVIPATGHEWDEGVITKEATTTEEGEKTYTCTKCGATKVETIPKIVTEDTPIYRLYNSKTKEHLYTASKNEYNKLPQYGWKQEGIGWYAPKTGTGVYRLYNPKTKDHHFTASKNEATTLNKKYGWTYDNNGKPLFYSGGKQPIYRLYNKSLKVGSHHFTASKNEYNKLPQYGWKQEGVAFYGTKIK